MDRKDAFKCCSKASLLLSNVKSFLSAVASSDTTADDFEEIKKEAEKILNEELKEIEKLLKKFKRYIILHK